MKLKRNKEDVQIVTLTWEELTNIISWALMNSIRSSVNESNMKYIHKEIMELLMLGYNLDEDTFKSKLEYSVKDRNIRSLIEK